jgi:hypothetical protein
MQVPNVQAPVLRLRRPTESLLGLPWDRPLAEWPATLPFRQVPVGESRHLVRFLHLDGTLYAFKEEPLAVARREFAVLRRLEEAHLPAVRPVALAERPTGQERGTAMVVTEYLRHGLQYRRLLGRIPAGPSAYRDRLLDAMTWLLVALHRGGVFWGDCSLANTLFRRDGDRIQAYLVDAETAEVHPSLSPGQRRHDLAVLEENLAYGLADIALAQGRPDLTDEAVEAAHGVVARYEALWDELHGETEIPAGDLHAVRRRIRRLNQLGFAVDEIELVPSATDRTVRLRVAVSDRSFHADELRRLTGLVALEHQARHLLNDLREYRAQLEVREGRPVGEAEGAERWLAEILTPTLARLAHALGEERDLLQTYCDLLEHKWWRSEEAGHDIGLAAAIESYLAIGAPAPEAEVAQELAAPDAGQPAPDLDAGQPAPDLELAIDWRFADLGRQGG